VAVERITVEFSFWEGRFLDPGTESSVNELDKFIGIRGNARKCRRGAVIADRRLEVIASLIAVWRVFDGFRVAYADDDAVGHVEFDRTTTTEGFRCSHTESIAVEDIPSSGVS
jgi:hypothetical protein